MRPSSMRLRLLFLAYICACLPLQAQDRGHREYHTEISQEPAPGGGAFLRVVLTNDSKQAIEAYDAQARCWSGDKWKDGSGTNYDSITNPNSFVMRPTQDGRSLVKQSTTLVPGGSKTVLQLKRDQPAGCEWKAEVDAVLYADGTYGGDMDAARSLEAYRDGWVAGVREWVRTFSQPGDLFAESATAHEKLLAMATEAQRRMDRDIVNKFCGDEPAICRYRFGRNGMDLTVVNHTKLGTKDTPDQTLQKLTDLIANLNAKIENDHSLTILDATFPPLNLPSSLSATGSPLRPTGEEGDSAPAPATEPRPLL